MNRKDEDLPVEPAAQPVDWRASDDAHMDAQGGRGRFDPPAAHPVGGQRDKKVVPVKLWASGGTTGKYADYLMSDGSICTLHIASGEVVSTVYASRPQPPQQEKPAAQPVGELELPEGAMVPPCKGDSKGTGFCEFHECENDCQGPFDPVPAQPVGEPEPEEHPRADCEGCFLPDCPCNMNEDWLDAELRANGIDPHKLNQKMLERIEQSIAEGHDTPRLHEAHAAFKRAVEPTPAPQATPNASFEEWATSRGMRLLKITEKAGYYYTRTRHAFEGWNAAQAYYERKIAEAEAERRLREEMGDE